MWRKVLRPPIQLVAIFRLAEVNFQLVVENRKWSKFCVHTKLQMRFNFEWKEAVQVIKRMNV